MDGLIFETSPMTSSKFPIWKVKPPGPEQLELEKMFRSKEIRATTSADGVRKDNALFSKFSAQVFSNHFRQTKAKLGLAATVPAANGSISELGTSSSNAAKAQVQGPSQSIDFDESETATEFPVSFKNPPFSTWSYTDFARKLDFVCVVVPIVSGSRNVSYMLSEDGMKVDIKYTWPRAVYSPSVLFNEEIERKTISAIHPKLHAFAAEMVRNGMTEESEPRGCITIELPCKVRRESNSWHGEAALIDGAKMAILEFTAFQKDIFIESTNRSLNFEDL